jgi:hypothetical protein
MCEFPEALQAEVRRHADRTRLFLELRALGVVAPADASNDTLGWAMFWVSRWGTLPRECGRGWFLNGKEGSPVRGKVAT